MKNKKLQISSDYLHELLSLLETEGHSPLKLIDELNLVIPKVNMIPLSTLERVLEFTKNELKISHIGAKLGMRLGSNKHGILGFAAKASINLLEALELDQKYLTTRIEGASLGVSDQNELTEISLHLSEELSHLKEFIIELVFCSLISFFYELYPNSKLIAVVQCEIIRPNDDLFYQNLTQLDWRFNKPQNVLRVLTSQLTNELPSSDHALKNLLVNQCKQEIKDNSKPETIAERVRTVLSKSLISPPKLNELADYLSINERTLKRRLAEEDTNYRSILTQIRISKSIQLLKETQLPIDEIAHRVGYESPNSFKRLFRQWTGSTPGSIRKSL